jgi:UDP-glucose 4-epimerase
MRVVVTGGAGYVGSVVADLLVGEGYDVTVLDDLSTGHRAAVPPAAEFVHGDLRDRDVLRRALRPGTDAVLHFAAQSIVPDSMRDPLGYWDHNVGGALALLAGVVEQGVRRFVFSSSAAVYGEPAGQPIPETAPPQPRHAYGGSKRAIEMLLEDASRSLGLRAVALRYFNAAGATARLGEDHRPETHLLPRLLGAAGGGAAVPVYGDDWPTPDGTCVRDYVHVTDLARAHVLALAALEGGLHGALNLGSGRGQSVREIVAAVRRVTGRSVPVRVERRRPGDPPCLVADVGRAAAELGWKAEIGLDDIVTSAWTWMRAHPRGYGDDAGGTSGRGARASDDT